MATLQVSICPQQDDDAIPAYAGKPWAHKTSLAIKATHTVIISSDGFTKVAQLVADIFSIFENLSMTISEFVKPIGATLRAFLDLTCIISLIKRCKEWFLPDDDGKMSWQRAWESIASLACLTASNILTFVSFLASTIKVVNLGKALFPCNLAGNIFTIASSGFDIIQSAHKLRDVETKNAQAIAAKKVWMDLSKELNAGQPLPDQWQQTIQKQKDVFERFSNAHSEAKAHWEALEKCTDSSQAMSFCNRKIEKLDVELEKHRITKIKNWIYIAASVALIAFTAISIAISFVTPLGLLIAALIAAVGASVTDLTSFLLDEFLKPKKVDCTQ